METDPVYLIEPYVKTLSKAKIIQINSVNNETSLILDKTIFYPMGGGQATDQGYIYDNTGNKYEVYQVLLKDGEINHYIRNLSNLVIGSEVNLEINWDRRYRNMKLHSAGHIIDFAIYLLGYSPKTLVPLKGDHNKDPHIIYGGIVEKDIKDEVQSKVDELISNDLEFYWEFVDFETLKRKSIYLQPNLPTNKPLRMLELKNVGAVADGGTIVKRTSEVGKITIRPLETINGNTIIRYTLI